MYFIVYSLFFFFSFFPYLNFLPIDTDAQPNAFVISILLLFFVPDFFKSLTKEYVALFVVLVFSLLVFLFSDHSLFSFRSFYNYVSLFFISFATYKFLKRKSVIPWNLYYISVWIWFIVGTIQYFIDDSFLTFLLPRGDSALTIETGRGIVCLSPEPTFYGMQCLLFWIVGYLNFRNISLLKIVNVLLIVQLFLYSKSSASIVIIFISVSLFLLHEVFSNKSNRKIVFFFIFFVLFSVFLIPVFSRMIGTSNRFGLLLNYFVTDPWMVLFLDASLNLRFINVFFPIYGFITNLGLPLGFNNWSLFSKEIIASNKFNFLFTDYALTSSVQSGRIMSGLGSCLFELGIVGLVPFIILWRSTKKIMKYDRMFFLVFLLYILLLLNAINFAHPLICVVLGNIIYLAHHVNNNKVT